METSTIISKLRLLLVFLFLGLTALTIYAQPRQSLTISGHLTDVDSKEAMGHVTVQLFWAKDSSFVGGTITNERGNFAVEAPSNGIYRLKITSVGYQTLERNINSYAMLHVRYRLNMFGGKVDTEGRYDSKWGNRDRRRW